MTKHRVMVRPRAPTITIDTTNLQPVDQESRLNFFHENSSATPEGRLTVPVDEGHSPSVDVDNVDTGAESMNSTSGIQSFDQHSTDELLGLNENDSTTKSPFAFSPSQLLRLIDPKSLEVFRAMGGLEGITRGVYSDSKAGLNPDETSLTGKTTIAQCQSPTKPSALEFAAGDTFQSRIQAFGVNRVKQKKSKSLFLLMWVALKDKVLIMLSIAALISLALGLYETLGLPTSYDPFTGKPLPKVQWVEGVAIIVAVVIVVTVGAGNDYQKERQFVKLNKKKEDRKVKAIRSGKSQEISIFDILVGDVILLEPGDVIPADGIFIAGHGVMCDESAATGESAQMKKTPGNDAIQAIESNRPLKKIDPFIISGARVLEGVGTYLVTAVGSNSLYGKTMESLQTDAEATPLQLKLNRIADAIAKIGGSSALLLFIVLFIRFLVGLKGNTEPSYIKGQAFMQILIVAITIVVVAVPEGLPLAVTLALAFATTKMLKDNNLVRVLASCETMGNATTICSDKTGTLTQNKMTVVAGTFGSSAKFATAATPVRSESPSTPVDKKILEKNVEHDEASQASTIPEFVNDLDAEAKQLIVDSIGFNSTAFEGDGGEHGFVGSKTETALLGFTKNYLGMAPVSELRESLKAVQVFPFDSGRKCMGVVLPQRSGKGFRMYIKGAAEIVLAQCTDVLDRVHNPGLVSRPITEEDMQRLANTIDTYASKSLRTIALVYRDFEQWPPKGVHRSEDDPNYVAIQDVFQNMTFLGVVGIQDPLRHGVRQAVADCQRAGVFVRMVTGDNVVTAQAIATDCGIYTEGGLVMEGPKFRKMSKAQMRDAIPKLQVLARSSPEDKKILVRRLRELGETVAVTGDGTNDGPALKAADVGFSMGIAGTEVAKEASAIILMDDNFASIVKAIMWGRAVNDAVKKFLQFQLTVNITAVGLAFVSAVASADQKSVLTAVQLLWVNLIMDTFAALALATDPPPKSILNRKPDLRTASLISVTMWKMIIGQAIFQLVVTFILNFAGKQILNYDTHLEMTQHQALVFNTFVWMQVFNLFNSRRLDNKFNIFEGIHRNIFFIMIALIMIGGQILIIFVGGAAFSITRLDGTQWGISLVLGALSIPCAMLIRLLPDRYAVKLVPGFVSRYLARQSARKEPMYDEERGEWSVSALSQVRDELVFLKRFRGGRLNQLRFKPQDIMRRMRPLSPHPSESASENGMAGLNSKISSEAPPSPDLSSNEHRRRSRSNSALSAAIMSASISAGSVGGGFYSPSNSQKLPFSSSAQSNSGPEGNEPRSLPKTEVAPANLTPSGSQATSQTLAPGVYTPHRQASLSPPLRSDWETDK